jgi:hypothetical protein
MITRQSTKYQPYDTKDQKKPEEEEPQNSFPKISERMLVDDKQAPTDEPYEDIQRKHEREMAEATFKCKGSYKGVLLPFKFTITHNVESCDRTIVESEEDLDLPWCTAEYSTCNAWTSLACIEC